jgi:hypothetical protein
MIVHAAALLPIAPILLLPFILIFFIVVFPFWLIAMGVLGILRLLVHAIGGGPEGGWAARVDGWFHWVKTFGGFTETYLRSDSPQQPK